MPCTTACSVAVMNDADKKSVRTCTTKSLLCAFVGLCFLMFGSVLVYWYHVNEIFTLSVKLTDNVKDFYEKDAKELLKVLRLTEFVNNGRTTQEHVISNLVSANVSTNMSTIAKTKNVPPKPPSDRPDTCEMCFRHDFNYILDNDEICQRNNNSPDIDVVVLIFTIHKNRQQRDTIRQTWLTYAKNNSIDSNVRYAFLLGAPSSPAMDKAVKEEFDIYQDILQEDFKDAYSNLTYKTMMAFKWASTKCKDAKFVMKTDDDMYVNIPNILTTLKTNKDKLQTRVGGACHQTAKPIRDHRSKWYASKKSFPGSHYPGFCSGTGYVTSMNVATKVFEVSKKVPFFHLEDVYVALCIKKLGYSLLAIPGFNAGRFRADPCIYHGKTMMTSHQVPPDMMKKMWLGKC
ncbi:beta-1,3-galactosyltransferase 1-like [Pecten maximus]|uniref:beta-1,3-galactosyltransferase 1-like n=1 Tax=Pecten maximus TaxID=6579 RepID=UPI001457FB8B|nr:beta-1,3-galactosyltransferase 1-like [Pecten maximus]XP_033758615.1 beta-1,3-galactosyltransferase 1-like [Pecten maximus]XP_033758616.1 beta-1,3-galactosyltransferase 1-like [Pecten maximus]XP_033758619.1 beta-1,3-galactosyltransferase 1-like [Pecten maximus]